jgi:hypothetical protein
MVKFILGNLKTKRNTLFLLNIIDTLNLTKDFLRLNLLQSFF